MSETVEPAVSETVEPAVSETVEPAVREVKMAVEVNVVKHRISRFLSFLWFCFRFHNSSGKLGGFIS